MTAWSVYLLRCSDGTLYCGTTTDVARRLAMHNGLLAGGRKIHPRAAARDACILPWRAFPFRGPAS